MRCTSDAVGRLTCSGRCTAVLSPQTELSRTSLGSRPSAITIFNLPIAVPLGHRCRAWLSKPLNCFTKPLSISSCTNLLSRWQWVILCGQPVASAVLKRCGAKVTREIQGFLCWRPLSAAWQWPESACGTPSSKMMGSCASLSCIVCASSAVH